MTANSAKGSTDGGIDAGVSLDGDAIRRDGESVGVDGLHLEQVEQRGLEGRERCRDQGRGGLRPRERKSVGRKTGGGERNGPRERAGSLLEKVWVQHEMGRRRAAGPCGEVGATAHTYPRLQSLSGGTSHSARSSQFLPLKMFVRATIRRETFLLSSPPTSLLMLCKAYVSLDQAGRARQPHR
jgi:hypothetical protein